MLVERSMKFSLHAIALVSVGSGYAGNRSYLMVGSYSCAEWLPTVSSDRVDKEVGGKTGVITSYDGTEVVET
jgi:hypothetical protein